MTETKKETIADGARAVGDEKLPWSAPRIETAEVGRETAATNAKIINENPNSIS